MMAQAMAQPCVPPTQMRGRITGCLTNRQTHTPWVSNKASFAARADGRGKGRGAKSDTSRTRGEGLRGRATEVRWSRDMVTQARVMFFSRPLSCIRILPNLNYILSIANPPLPTQQDSGAARTGVTGTAISEPAVTNAEVASEAAPASSDMDTMRANVQAVPRTKREPISIDQLQAVVLAGGPSTGNPLTKFEARASLKFAASYRLIDFPMGNIINSGMKRAFVLTQFNSYTLNQHVQAAYPPEVFGFGSTGYVYRCPTPPQRTPPISIVAQLKQNRTMRRVPKSTVPTRKQTVNFGPETLLIFWRFFFLGTFWICWICSRPRRLTCYTLLSLSP